MAARGDVEQAASRAARSGRGAIQRQHIAWGALLLHDAVRLDGPESVVDELVRLTPDRGADLLDAMATHATALVGRDAGALLVVARRFAAMSAPLLAAEASAHAVTVLGGVEAVRAAALSAWWQLRCQDPRTPALRSRPSLVTLREVEIAVDASRDRTSAQIAEQHYLSVRTVDNHLRSVYRKLAVSGRQELPEVFAPLLA